MKRFILLLLIVITICSGFYFYKSKKDNWDTLTLSNKNCGIEGTAQNRDDKEANRLKNRWIMPKNKDFDSNFTWNILFEEGDENPKKYSPNNAARIMGYVAYISKSGKETCNCGYKEPEFHDYHINLVADTSYYKDKTQHLIVEITPRLRAIMKAQGVDWNLNALKKKIYHKRIEVEGWLFYDWEHGDKAYLRTGDTTKSWRATCWEIHPVTSLKVLE
jgi:hypothetical protein